jgi:outer membrane protein with beta-barrel domain
MMSALSRHGLVHAVVATVLLILPTSALAQQVGVTAGANLASLTPEEDEDPDTSRRLGPVGGVWVRMASSSRLSFQVEGLFSEKGVKVEAPAIGVDSADVRLRYLEIPALARADFGASGLAARAFVVGGAAPAFKLSARARAASGGQEQNRDIADEIYSLDLGLVGGLGLEFGRALIEARYTHGLRHINTDDNGEGDRIKNRVFSVTVGFRLR